MIAFIAFLVGIAAGYLLRDSITAAIATWHEWRKP